MSILNFNPSTGVTVAAVPQCSAALCAVWLPVLQDDGISLTMDLNSVWADSIPRGLRAACCVCGRQLVVYCIVRAVMKRLTEREEVAVVGTKLQNVELHDTGRRYCDQRG